MKSSRYTMDFQNGVKFDMAVVMSDTITAATAATLMKGVADHAEDLRLAAREVRSRLRPPSTPTQAP